MQHAAFLGLQDMGFNMKQYRYYTKIEDINSIAQEIAKNKTVKAVYLFGSYAKEKPHILSDIDICIITNGDKEDTVNFPVTDNLDVSFFHRLPLMIQYRVFKEGKPLVVKDKEYIDNLKIMTLKKYLDLKPFINRFIWEKLKCTI